MIDVDLDARRLRIRFTPLETLLGVVHDLDVPLSAVTSAQLLPDPWPEVRGWRIGCGVRRLWYLGTWWRPGHRQLVALRRDQEALRIRVTGGFHDELLVSSPHPRLVLARLHDTGVRTDRLVAV